MSFRFPEPQWGTVGATQRLQRGRSANAGRRSCCSRAGPCQPRRLWPWGYWRGLSQTSALAGDEIAAAIGKPPPLAMALTKQAIDLGEEVALTTGIRIELAAIERNLAEGGWRDRARGLRPQRLVSFDPAVLCPLTTDAALRRAVALAPDVEAIVGPGGRLTYAELAGRSRTHPRRPRPRLGVRRGDHVGVCLGNGPRWVALFLALGSMGAVTVPDQHAGCARTRSAMRCDNPASARLVMTDQLLRVDFVAMLRALLPGHRPCPARARATRSGPPCRHWP